MLIGPKILAIEWIERHLSELQELYAGPTRGRFEMVVEVPDDPHNRFPMPLGRLPKLVILCLCEPATVPGIGGLCVPLGGHASRGSSVDSEGPANLYVFVVCYVFALVVLCLLCLWNTPSELQRNTSPHKPQEYLTP